MKGFVKEWVYPNIAWCITFILFLYGAGFGHILPESKDPNAWLAVLYAHLYASHVGVVIGVALWLLTHNEPSATKWFLRAFGVLAAIAYMGDLWGVAPAGFAVPTGAYLRGVALGLGYICAMWVLKYRLLAEFKKLFTQPK